MGCCCGKEDDDASLAAARRHPLLRDHVSDSTATPSINNPNSNSTTTDPIHLSSLETRAHFDALHGPPLMMTMKDDFTRSPDILRGSLKGSMKMEYFRLPENGFPVHVWLKVHLKDMIDHICVFNTLMNPHCKRATCKTMTGPPNIDYKWTCDKNGFFSDKIEKSISAASYIVKVIDTSKMLLKTHFRNTLTKMEEKTYEAGKVYCHLLYHHHDIFVDSYTLPHLNSCFIWFILFSTEAQLLEEIKECEPLKALVTDIVRTAQEGGEEDCEYDEENGLQLKMSCDDRMSSFLNSFSSDDVSKLTASSFGTEKSIATVYT